MQRSNGLAPSRKWAKIKSFTHWAIGMGVADFSGATGFIYIGRINQQKYALEWICRMGNFCIQIVRRK